jgi:dienelactone hydrolase
MLFRISSISLLTLLTACTLLCPAQLTTRPDPSDPVHSFDTPAAVGTPASDAQLLKWREQIRAALFLPKKMPALEARNFGSFVPMPGVIAHRVTYASQYGMRIPAIVYGPDHASGKLPAIIVVAGHGGDKTTWYEVYAGLLYASAGAMVVTYDPVGEDERNALRRSDSRSHDTVLTGKESPPRLGGVMIGDVISAVEYAAGLPSVDKERIAVLGYSMGSFHAAIAAALEPRIHALVLSGGGDLDGNGGSWDSSSKSMCQSGPYQALSFLPDKAAILYALHQRSGSTLVLNGAEDNLVAKPHHMESFFADLNRRVAALAGPGASPIEYTFYPNVGHRPSWVNRDAATWLNAKLHFPRWRNLSLDSLGETHISEWAATTGSAINHGYDTEKTEGGIRALDHGFPAPTRAQLQVVPVAEWDAHAEQYSWQGLARKILLAQELPALVPEPVSLGNEVPLSTGSKP